MMIPSRKISGFVSEITQQCFSSRKTRISRGIMYENFFSVGNSDPTNPALFQKIYESLDNVASLLYSPVSLRFIIGDQDEPNLLMQAKCKRSAAKIRNYAERSDTDSMISAAVLSSLKRGKSFIKQLWRKDTFRPCLISPDDMGVLRENVLQLDEDMEAFSHKMLITPWQFARLVANHPNERELVKEAKRYVRSSTGEDMAKAATMQVTVGGLYPFQLAGGQASNARGVVDWLSQPTPEMSPDVQGNLLELDETWIWDDRREDWATFQLVGGKMLIMGDMNFLNALAYDPVTKQSAPSLKGKHPFHEFCVNPLDDPPYFWGDSEIRRLIPLQEAINSRIAGVNKMLRMEEEPTRTFTGGFGINQEAVSRINKPGGWWADSNPSAKATKETVTIPQDVWNALHEYERMFDDIEGVPPIARGKGESGVRSHLHAETLVRQFSPRFKDRALLAERSVSSLGGTMLDMCRAHDDTKMIAWAPAAEAGDEGVNPDTLKIAPPAPGFVAIPFKFGDLPEEVTLRVDSHSSSPAFAQDAKALHFDLLKVGAEGPEDLIEHVDATNPEELEFGIARRAIARAEEQKRQDQLKAAKGGKH